MPATLVLNLIKIQGLVEEIDQKIKVTYFDIVRYKTTKVRKSVKCKEQISFYHIRFLVFQKKMLCSVKESANKHHY